MNRGPSSQAMQARLESVSWANRVIQKVEQCGLTPPSSGRSKGRFAPFGPPLMSNVRPR